MTNSSPIAPSALDRRLERARYVGDAVLYEGYILYPYRASAAKNQARWQWGVLAPGPFAESDGSESSAMQTECLVEVRAGARVHVRVRCLQLQARVVEQAAGVGTWRALPSLEVDGQLWTSWDETVERQIDACDLSIASLSELPHSAEVTFTATEELELLEGSGRAARIRRQRWPVDARLDVSAHPIEGPYPLVRLRVAVSNTTAWDGPAHSRDDIMRRSLVAVHVLLAVDKGRFVSSLDPPQFAKAALTGCTNVGAFPVLVGDGTEDVVLASPIILYDHPCVAPESAGDMFDATEIDEILALRVLTMTDDEKREARQTDPRAAAIVDRCDAMSPEAFARLHGSVRSLEAVGSGSGGDQFDEPPWWDPEVDARFDPWTDSVRIGTTDVTKGTRVQLCPSRRADAQDLFLAGRPATVQGVFHDVDGEAHLAVVLDDDPGADLHDGDGRYLYFHLEEVTILGADQ